MGNKLAPGQLKIARCPRAREIGAAGLLFRPSGCAADYSGPNVKILSVIRARSGTHRAILAGLFPEVAAAFRDRSQPVPGRHPIYSRSQARARVCASRAYMYTRLVCAPLAASISCRSSTFSVIAPSPLFWRANHLKFFADAISGEIFRRLIELRC